MEKNNIGPKPILMKNYEFTGSDKCQENLHY